VEAGAIRLRPVVLTAACAVLGMVPIALGWMYDVHHFEMLWKSQASEMWMGMAIAMIYGLTFATLLTLVVVPCLYVMLFRLSAKLGLGGLKKGDEDEADRTSRVA